MTNRDDITRQESLERLFQLYHREQSWWRRMLRLLLGMIGDERRRLMPSGKYCHGRPPK
jgi:hypothetical protein